MVEETELLVIGGGPGGYSAAIRGAQLGKKTVLVEKENLGGTCLNRGCIPTKVYLQVSEILNKVKKASFFGVKASVEEVDIDKLRAKKEDTVNSLVSGVSSLLEANGVILKEGRARFKNNNTVIINDGEEITADNIIIATGSREIELDIPGMNLDGVINSDKALEINEIPKSLAVIGGGVIGLELAELYSSLGAEVKILEALPMILPNEDFSISEEVERIYGTKGISIQTSSIVKEIRDGEDGKEVLFAVEDEEKSMKVEKVLVAVGRQGNIESLGLENTDVKHSSKGISVKENLQTSVQGIYAVGDVIEDGIKLAHVAMYQGEKAAEIVGGLSSSPDHKAVPGFVYLRPEVASVGLTEKEVKEAGYDYEVGLFPLMGNGKAVLMDESEGFFKIIVDNHLNEILGVHILGPKASELIGEAALALKLECTAEEIIDTIHPHPTVGESYREAAMDVFKRAIHFKR